MPTPLLVDSAKSAFHCAFLILAVSACNGALGRSGPGPAPYASDGGTGEVDAPARADAGRTADTPRDSCGNSIDDDRDGEVDENCPCFTMGATQPCWPGDPANRNIGACSDGVQMCVGVGEFLQWGGCTGASPPTDEIDGNGVDEDCDGRDGAELTCVAREFGESCGDGTDGDCDGLIDCDDPDCASSPICGGTTCAADEFSCTDGLDDDCDGRADCSDESCATDPACEEVCEEAELDSDCYTGVDEDCDGLIDCEDPDCTDSRYCAMDEFGCNAFGSERPVFESPIPPIRGGRETPHDGPCELGHTSGPPTHYECRYSSCPEGRVGVFIWEAHPSGGFSGEYVCVPPPPDCGEGQYADYYIDEETGEVLWMCREQCDELTIFYDCGLHCVPEPDPCETGVPTYDYRNHRWTCECAYGNYHREDYTDPTGGSDFEICLPCF